MKHFFPFCLLIACLFTATPITADEYVNPLIDTLIAHQKSGSLLFKPSNQYKDGTIVYETFGGDSYFPFRTLVIGLPDGSIEVAHGDQLVNRSLIKRVVEYAQNVNEYFAYDEVGAEIIDWETVLNQEKLNFPVLYGKIYYSKDSSVTVFNGKKALPGKKIPPSKLLGTWNLGTDFTITFSDNNVATISKLAVHDGFAEYKPIRSYENTAGQTLYRTTGGYAYMLSRKVNMNYRWSIKGDTLILKGTSANGAYVSGKPVVDYSEYEASSWAAMKQQNNADFQINTDVKKDKGIISRELTNLQKEKPLEQKWLITEFSDEGFIQFEDLLETIDWINFEDKSDLFPYLDYELGGLKRPTNVMSKGSQNSWMAYAAYGKHDFGYYIDETLKEVQKQKEAEEEERKQIDQQNRKAYLNMLAVFVDLTTNVSDLSNFRLANAVQMLGDDYDKNNRRYDYCLSGNSSENKAWLEKYVARFLPYYYMRAQYLGNNSYDLYVKKDPREASERKVIYKTTIYFDPETKKMDIKKSFLDQTATSYTSINQIENRF